MTEKFKLSDFNTKSENVLGKESKPKTSTKTPRKKERLEQKIQVGLTQEEYDKLYANFEASGLHSFAGFCRMKLKEIKFI